MKIITIDVNGQDRDSLAVSAAAAAGVAADEGGEHPTRAQRTELPRAHAGDPARGTRKMARRGEVEEADILFACPNLRRDDLRAVLAFASDRARSASFTEQATRARLAA